MTTKYTLVGGASPIDCGTNLPFYSQQEKGWVAGPLVVSDPAQHLSVQQAALLPTMDPMTFYLAFQLQERIDIKASPDAKVMEFWDTYQRCERTNKPIDPNSTSVQQGLAYLSIPKTATPPGPGILANNTRITQILQGIPQ